MARNRARITIVGLAALVAAGLAAVATPAVRTTGGSAPPPMTVEQAADAYGKLPLRFEPNLGQTDPEAKFLARGPGYNLFLTPGAAVLSLGRAPDAAPPAPRPPDEVVRLKVVGGNLAAPLAGLDRQPGTTNYLSGTDAADSHTDVPGFASVVQQGIYPGVDLVYHGRQGQIEYDFDLDPGVDPATIAVAVEGSTALRVAPEGHLEVTTASGTGLRQKKPVAWQEVGGQRRDVPVAFALRGADRFGFTVGAHDPGLPLLIDPVLEYSTYLGGTSNFNGDQGTAIAVDAAGSAYVTGYSRSVDFPTKNPFLPLPVFQSGCPFCIVPFVTKLSPDGSSLVYSTYLRGRADAAGLGIAVDGGSNAAITGYTNGSSGFPTLAAAQPNHAGQNDAFVTKLNPAGNGLVFSTFLGGSGNDRGLGVAVDGTGRIYVAADTSSSGIATTTGSFDRACGTDGLCNASAAATFTDGATTAGSQVFASTAAGFTSADAGKPIAGPNLQPGTAILFFNGGNTVFLSKPATATGTGLTFTVGRGDARDDGYLARYTAAGALDYAGFLGGSARDDARGVAVDAAGNAYVTGSTCSADLPTVNAAQATAGGQCDAYAAKVTAGGSSLGYSTYLGGSGDENPFGSCGIFGGDGGIDADGAGNAYVVGGTTSSDFPTTAGVLKPAKAADDFTDSFVVKLAPDGSRSYSTYLGGDVGFGDTACDVAADGAGNAHVVTARTATDFPSVDPVQGPGGLTDGYVAKLNPTGAALVWSTPIGGSASDNIAAVAVDAAGAAYVTGGTQSDDLPTVRPFQDRPGGVGANVGQSDQAFVAKIAPTPPAAPVVNGLAPLSGDASGGTTVTLTGRGLTGAIAVRFGTVAATSFTVVNATTITAVSPAQAPGRVPVVVTGAGGASAANPASSFEFARGGWAPTGSVATPRIEGKAVQLRGPACTAATPPAWCGRVLVAGGINPPIDDSNLTTDLYDPVTGTWSTCPAATPSSTCPGPMNGFQRGGAKMVVLDDGRVLMAGGFGRAPEVYTPSTGTWALAGTLSAGRRDAQLTVLGGPACADKCGKALLSGGSSASQSELYDPATNTWSSTGQQVDLVRAASSVLVGSKVLVPSAHCQAGFCEGQGGLADVIASSQLYDPATGSWSPTGSVGQGREDYSLVRLDGPGCADKCGQVLMAGGQTGDSGGFQSDVSELYDPATGEFKPTAPLLAGRYHHASTRLPDGRVLVAGGSTADFGTRRSAEVYDPAAGRWASAGQMGEARGGRGPNTELTPPAAVLLDPAVGACGTRCGTVLVVGGQPFQPAFPAPGITATEVYTPRPTVSGLTPNRGPAAGGTLVTVRGTGFTNGPVTVRFGGVVVPAGSVTVVSYSELRVTAPVLAFAAVDVTVQTTAGGRSDAVPASRFTSVVPPALGGYRLVASDGGIFAFGNATFHGSTGGVPLARPIVGMATTPSGNGYWLVASDGGIFAFGDAVFRGSTGGVPLVSPIVGMASTNSGGGYWLVASDGGIFAFGDAVFRGSTGGVPLTRPIVGMATTPSGNGYWLVAADGGIFAFGDAVFRGSTGGTPLVSPIVGMASTNSGGGYWLVAADGGIFAFGDAVFRGSIGGTPLARPVVGMATTPSGNGYWMVASDGGIFAFGDAPFLGSTGGTPLTRPIVGMAGPP